MSLFRLASFFAWQALRYWKLFFKSFTLPYKDIFRQPSSFVYSFLRCAFLLEPWLGFPSKYFLSGDYYPLLPYAMLYLCGASFNRSALRHGYPRALMKLSCPIISEIGKHPLSIYLLHQPLLLLLVSLLTGRALF